MTYYQDQRSDNDSLEEMDVDFVDNDEMANDENYEDLPDEVIFHQKFQNYWKL